MSLGKVPGRIVGGVASTRAEHVRQPWQTCERQPPGTVTLRMRMSWLQKLSCKTMWPTADPQPLCMPVTGEGWALTRIVKLRLTQLKFNFINI